MEKRSSSSSSEDIETEGAQAEAGAYKWHACFLVEAVKGIVLKCFGVISNVPEPCLPPSDPPPSTSDPPTTTGQGDGAGVSLATPPRPGGTTGPGPQIN